MEVQIKKILLNTARLKKLNQTLAVDDTKYRSKLAICMNQTQSGRLYLLIKAQEEMAGLK
jgi:hypothetical protein